MKAPAIMSESYIRCVVSVSLKRRGMAPLLPPPTPSISVNSVGGLSREQFAACCIGAASASAGRNTGSSNTPAFPIPTATAS
jgi:hypothetical protein